jgi:thymidylate synthase
VSERPVRTQYGDFVRHVLATGAPKHDRTGTGTVSVFGYQMRFDLTEGFPLVTTKKVHFPSVAYDLLWFLRGDSNVHWLEDHGVTIWDEWADEEGELGPVYGVQWRSWPTRTRASTRRVSYGCCTTIDSRRMIVSAWNVADLPKWLCSRATRSSSFTSAEARDGARPASCQIYQRSADVFLGVPFNIASYALLTHMLAQQCHLTPGDLIGPAATAISTTTTASRSRRSGPRSYPFPSSLRRRPDSIFDYLRGLRGRRLRPPPRSARRSR